MRQTNNVIQNSQEGFSLVELLVVLALIGIIGGLISSMYLFGQRMINEWKEDLKVENELHTIIHGMSEDLFKAQRIKALQPQKISLKMADDLERTYRAKEDRLYRNNKLLTSKDYVLISFELSTNVEEKPIFSTPKTSFEAAKIISIKIGLTNGKDTLSSSRDIYLRTGSNWQSLKN